MTELRREGPARPDAVLHELAPRHRGALKLDLSDGYYLSTDGAR
jgi:hypothetical protein